MNRRRFLQTVIAVPLAASLAFRPHPWAKNRCVTGSRITRDKNGLIPDGRLEWTSHYAVHPNAKTCQCGKVDSEPGLWVLFDNAGMSVKRFRLIQP